MVFVGLAFVALAPMVAVLSRPAERSYAFLPDHPVDLWHEGRDRWAYYMVGPGPSAEWVRKVRPALLTEGFREDPKRWIGVRFVRGGEEVVVCDHDEFATMQDPWGNTKLVRSTGTTFADPWSCVLVKNGPGTHDSPTLFAMKKVLYGW